MKFYTILKTNCVPLLYYYLPIKIKYLTDKELSNI